LEQIMRRPPDEKKAQHITCVNNLKQIGLAFRVWSGDNQDQYPFNRSTNAGGTREFCALDKDGFDRHTILHLLVMSNELSTPKILFCPQDRAKHAATNWADLTLANVTYRLRSGANVNETNPQAILAVCPVDGNILYCDGSVKEHK
jgi:prepilin-type processing-associated H-X9-DG protein